MRILVISDSHGRTSEIEKAIEAQKDAKHIFFLGDCVRDIEDCPFIYEDRTFHIVSGNCDGETMNKTSDSIVLNGRKIFFTHGHFYGVKGGISKLKEKAIREGFDLVLYGHTHTSDIQYADGIHFVNPGSLCSGRGSSTGYAVIDIEKNGIMPIIIKT